MRPRRAAATDVPSSLDDTRILPFVTDTGRPVAQAFKEKGHDGSWPFGLIAWPGFERLHAARTGELTLLKAFPAKDRAPLSRTEWNGCFFSAR